MDWLTADSVIKAVLVAVLGIIGFFVRDYRRVRNSNIKTEKTIPLEVRGVAATTFEAEVAALHRSFDQDRAIKDNTIRSLLEDNARLVQDKEAALEEKERSDQRAAELEREVDDLRRRLRELQTQVQELLDTVELMSEKISQEKVKNGEKNEDFRVHPRTGS